VAFLENGPTGQIHLVHDEIVLKIAKPKPKKAKALSKT